MNCEYIHQRCLNQEFKRKQHKRAITKFVSNATVICEETEQVVLNDGFTLYFNFVGEKQVSRYRTEKHQLHYLKF